MIRAPISGRLYGAPARRTGQSGTEFVTGKLRVDTGDEHPAWASVIFFGEAGQRLGAPRDGDAAAAAGRLTLRAFIVKDGNPKAAMSIVADEVAAVRRKPKPRVSDDRDFEL